MDRHAQGSNSSRFDSFLPTQCVANLTIIVAEKFDPSPLAHVQHFLIKDVLETLMISVDDTLCSEQIMSPDFKSKYNCAQLQIMNGIVLLMDFELSRCSSGSPDFKSKYNCAQLQIMNGIVLLMDFELSRCEVPELERHPTDLFVSETLLFVLHPTQTYYLFESIGLRIDQNVVDEDDNKLIQIWHTYTVHKVHEQRRSIGQPERHGRELKMSVLIGMATLQQALLQELDLCKALLRETRVILIDPLEIFQGAFHELLISLCSIKGSGLSSSGKLSQA
ncbi:hypothetical protein Tco_0323278 [Tanacetum coccineum]